MERGVRNSLTGVIAVGEVMDGFVNLANVRVDEAGLSSNVSKKGVDGVRVVSGFGPKEVDGDVALHGDLASGPAPREWAIG